MLLIGFVFCNILIMGDIQGMTASPSENDQNKKNQITKVSKKSAGEFEEVIVESQDNLTMLAETALNELLESKQDKEKGSLSLGESKKRVIDTLLEDDLNQKKTVQALVQQAKSFYDGGLNCDQEKKVVKELIEHILYQYNAKVELEKVNKKLQEEVDDLEGYQETYRHANKRLNQSIENLTKEKTKLKERVEFLNSERKSLEKEKRILFDDCKAQIKQVELMRSCLEQYRNSYKELTEQWAILVEYNNKLINNNENLKRQNENLKIKNENLVKDNNNLINKNKKIRKALMLNAVKITN